MWSRIKDILSRRVATRARRHRVRRQSAEDRLSAAERDLARGRRDRAARQALELAAEHPRDLARMNRIGDLLMRADQIKPGLALFERVGRAYADDGFWAKAIAIYKKILRHDPWRSDIQAQLAFLYQRSGLPTGGIG